MASDSTATEARSVTDATFTAKDGKGILITEPAMKQLASLMGQQGSGKVLRVGCALAAAAA